MLNFQCSLFFQFGYWVQKILNFQCSLFFQFRCWVQVQFIRLNNILRTNIEFSKFTIFLVKILDLMHFQALSYDFMKKYWIFNVHYFSSSDVGFNAFSSVFIQFHEQILNFQSSLFSSSDVGFKSISFA